MIEAPAPAMVERKGAKGAERTKRTVDGSTTWTSFKVGKESAGPWAIFFRRSKENFTAAASTGEPSSNLWPCASLKVQVVLASSTVQLSASCGAISVEPPLYWTRRS